MLVLQKLAVPGSFVKKGDIVAEFDRQYMLIRLDDYKAMADQHERNVLRLKAYRAVVRAAYEQRMLVAKGTMEKAEVELKKAPILSEINREKLRLDYEEAKARYEELRDDENNLLISETAAVARSEADLRVSKLEYERARRNADRMLVKAPLDGMVVMMTMHRGGQTNQIQEGDQIGSGQPYMRIVDLRNMVVNANVNQVDAQMVHLGMPARVRFDAYPEVELPARVTSVGAFAQSGGWRGTYVRNVPIRIKLEGTDPRVIPDLTVSADLVLGETDNATIVPREAVFGDEAQPYAFVREADGGWEKRPLDVVMTSNTAVAVRSGVSPGDVLAAEWPGQESGAQSRN
jgi:multidrug efflux pump subunit AcrA (membrane-fusion protein)